MKALMFLDMMWFGLLTLKALHATGFSEGRKSTKYKFGLAVIVYQ